MYIAAFYKDWAIVHNPKPIPTTDHDFDFHHEDYDGVEDGNHLCGTASSIEDAIRQIKEIEEEDATNQAQS